MKTLHWMTLGILFTALNTSLVSAHELGSNKNPIMYGKDQTIVDLSKVVWEPLNADDPKGPEIAMLRGDFDKGGSESFLRLPPNYHVKNHNHTSDEVYVWLKGSFTLIAHDGTETQFDGPAFISFPGNAPPHALRCGSKEPCIFYLRYSRPFDIEYFPEARQRK